MIILFRSQIFKIRFKRKRKPIFKKSCVMITTDKMRNHFWIKQDNHLFLVIMQSEKCLMEKITQIVGVMYLYIILHNQGKIILSLSHSLPGQKMTDGTSRCAPRGNNRGAKRFMSNIILHMNRKKQMTIPIGKIGIHRCYRFLNVEKEFNLVKLGYGFLPTILTMRLIDNHGGDCNMKLFYSI